MRKLPVFRRVSSVPCLLTAAAVCLFAVAAQAGKVEISYVAPEKFTDIGFGSFERERSLSNLTEIFDGLARFLPDGQTLRIEVLDVDLAGEVFARPARDYRVVRGGVDWPQVTLRYSLQAAGSTLQSGEERVRDINYTFTRRGLTAGASNLPYEKRMLENWFRGRFLKAQ